jgi:hypothetical protein
MTVRFKGAPGEQATLFFYDPSGNALEFKAFKDLKQLFAQYPRPGSGSACRHVNPRQIQYFRL